jgi:hypothetical protein
MINQRSVKKTFHYDPASGLLTRLIATSNSVKIGEEAGWLATIGYRYVSIESKKYLTHRVIWLYMTGSWPKHHVDHRNGNGTDNRWSNLRAATPSQNLMNQKMNAKNTSGVKGVYFDKARPNQSWCAEIKVAGKKQFLGRFTTKAAAALARRAAAARVFGEYAGAATH